MTAEQRAMIRQLLLHAPFDLGGDVSVQRPLFEQMISGQPVPNDVVVTPHELGGVGTVVVEIDGAPSHGTILHIHGGGFAIGSAQSSVGLAAELARRTDMRVVSVDYRLAPEHPYPAALDDVTAAYRALLDEIGTSDRVVVSGESAGGNLALALLIAGRAEQLAMPAGVVLMSPVTDLSATGRSYIDKADVDPVLSEAAIRTRVADYLAGADPNDPLVSPIHADLTGLPPLLIQAGSDEVLLDDATGLAARAAAHGVAVILDVTPGVPHVFQAFAAFLDEGAAALDRVGYFIRSTQPVETS